MKKLFISCPMKGRTEENIRKSMKKMHDIAEIYFDEKLEVISTYIEDNPPENNNQAIWYLGKSIQLLAEADYFIGLDYSCDYFKGCIAERNIANDYGIRMVTVNMSELMPDAAEIQKYYYDNLYTGEPIKLI